MSAEKKVLNILIIKLSEVVLIKEIIFILTLRMSKYLMLHLQSIKFPTFKHTQYAF